MLILEPFSEKNLKKRYTLPDFLCQHVPVLSVEHSKDLCKFQFPCQTPRINSMPAKPK
jgi:hypothetical protein